MIPKFRAWHKELERMMSVQTIWLDEGEISELELDDSFMNDSIPVYRDEVALMQSTGLFDKNGQEIWEGDVVRVTCEHPIDFPDCQGVVRMLEGRYMVCDDKNERGSELFSEIFLNEVIGNTYENPELVEGLK